MTTRRYAKPCERNPTIRVLSNQIVCARVPHTLKCGCTVKPGLHYHRMAVLVNGSFVAQKQHLQGMCMEVLH